MTLKVADNQYGRLSQRQLNFLYIFPANKSEMHWRRSRTRRLDGDIVVHRVLQLLASLSRVGPHTRERT